jgi:lysyl-tRNA synthetase class II
MRKEQKPLNKELESLYDSASKLRGRILDLESRLFDEENFPVRYAVADASRAAKSLTGILAMLNGYAVD